MLSSLRNTGAATQEQPGKSPLETLVSSFFRRKNTHSFSPSSYRPDSSPPRRRASSGGPCRQRVRVLLPEIDSKPVSHHFQKRETSRSLNSSPVTRFANPPLEYVPLAKCDSIPEESEEDLAAIAKESAVGAFVRQTHLSRSARFNDNLTLRRRPPKDPLARMKQRDSYHSAPPGIYWPDFLESLAEERDEDLYGGAWFGSGNDLYIRQEGIYEDLPHLK
ncbi:hypothetical protein Ciccas_008528 [Cichlidogyrus casuarinus]|uniref:Uncharacterized protein n=1 Tax=Cichlidogyrus casuarinus TaxID=1844966 RepID=A0ABD2Q3Y0_9PLAT